jgi:coenzyme F420-reducing hydrogenase beta subunit
MMVTGIHSATVFAALFTSLLYFVAAIHAFATTYTSLNANKPIDPRGWPDRFPAKEHCSKCGLCETSFVKNVTGACAFLGDGMARMDDMEEVVHGRRRNLQDMVWSGSSGTAEEARFGVLHEPVRLAKGNQIADAQWTGVVTGIALSMLETNRVDAVVCIANDDKDSGNSFASPRPIIARTSQEILTGRGIKPALAPSLRVLDDIQKDPSIKRLLFCGVGCAVQAFRAIQSELHLDEVYVLGTNCADNSPTPEAAQAFIRDGVKIGNTSNIKGYEFMQDFKVHVKTEDAYVTKPYFALPGTIAEQSIATSCRACFDYTNALADVVVGYMGAPLDDNARMDESYQTLTVRNERGAKMVQAALETSRLVLGTDATGKGSHEKLALATISSDALVAAMVDQPVPKTGIPGWIGEFMAFGMSRFGPKGISFARYSIDYHVLRNYLHVLDAWGKGRAEQSTPEYARVIVKRYLSSDDEFAKLVSFIEAKQKQRKAVSTAMACKRDASITGNADNERRKVLSTSLASVATAALCAILQPSPSEAAAPLDAGEAIRRGAAKIPGYGQTDVFYPKSFEGTWKATREVEFNGRSDSTLRLTYLVRFIRSIEDSAVVADRGFNQVELEKSIVSTVKGESAGTAVLTFEWTQSNPNDLRIVMSDGTKKEIKVTKRATERTDSTVSSSEFQRVTQEDQRGIPIISARRVVSKWKTMDDSTLEGLEIVYDMGGGDPLAGAASKEGSILSKSRLVLKKQS